MQLECYGTIAGFIGVSINDILALLLTPISIYVGCAIAIGVVYLYFLDTFGEKTEVRCQVV